MQPVQQVQQVQVSGTRTRLVPYADLFYPMAKAVQQALGGRAALAVQLRGTRQGSDVEEEDLGGHEVPGRVLHQDLTAADLESAVKTIAGSARSMGVTTD